MGAGRGGTQIKCASCPPHSSHQYHLCCELCVVEMYLDALCDSYRLLAETAAEEE